MHKTLILAGIALALLLPGALIAADEYTTMKGMVEDLAEYVEYLEDEMNQEIVNLHVDIIFEGPESYMRPLSSDWTYLITAFADWRVADLDIIVYKDVDGEWVEIERDEETDNYPTVVVEPTSNATYLIEIDVYSFVEGYTAAHYGLIISHEYE